MARLENRELMANFVYQNYDGASISKTALPRCEQGEVLLKLEAADLNLVDLLYVNLLLFTLSWFSKLLDSRRHDINLYCSRGT